MKKILSVLASCILIPVIPSLIATIVYEPFRAWCLETVSVHKCVYIGLIIIIATVGALGYALCTLLNKYKRKKERQQISYYDELEQRFKEIVDEIDYLQSIQLYKYRLYTSGKEEKISVNYLCGYSDTDVSINAIQQDCYSVPIDLFRKYNEASQKYNRWLQLQGAQAQSMLHQYVESAEKLSSEFERLLLADQHVDELKCCLYRLYRAQKSNVRESRLIDFIFNNEEYQPYETDLLLYKRSGLLPSIFFEDTRFFRNVSGRSKNGRVYMTFRCNRVQHPKRCIILLALNGTVASATKSIQEIEKEIEKAFNTLL